MVSLSKAAVTGKKNGSLSRQNGAKGRLWRLWRSTLWFHVELVLVSTTVPAKASVSRFEALEQLQEPLLLSSTFIVGWYTLQSQMEPRNSSHWCWCIVKRGSSWQLSPFFLDTILLLYALFSLAPSLRLS